MNEYAHHQQVNKLKQYIVDLELQVQKLEEENHLLKNENEQLKKKIEGRKRPKLLNDISKATLESWWWEMTPAWQKALNHAVLGNGETVFIPSEKQLRKLFSTTKLELVGTGILLFGLNQLSFKLEDCSGLQYFTNLKDLNISGNAIKNLTGLEHLTQLEVLNCTSNKITTIQKIRHLKNLKTLIIRDNKLTTLSSIHHLKKLEYLDVLYNSRLKSLGRLGELKELKTLIILDHKETIRQDLKLLLNNTTLEIKHY